MSGPGLFAMLAGGAKGAATIAPKGEQYTGPDGKERYVIDDSKAQLGMLRPGQHRLGDILQHPELYERYPQLADLRLYIYKEAPTPASQGLYAWYVADDNSIGINLKAFGRNPNPRDVMPELLHELQHAIQKQEGFAYGSTAEQVDKQLVEGAPTRELVMKHVDRVAREYYGAPYASLDEDAQQRVQRITAYQLQAGEIEARAVGEGYRLKRFDPRQHYDYPEGIVRRSGEDAAVVGSMQ